MTHRNTVAARPWMGVVAALLYLLAMAACTDRHMEPARQAIADIEAAVSAAGTEPAKYVPHLVSDIDSQVAVLKNRFEREDYAGVLQEAPKVLAAAKELPVAAANRRDELHALLRQGWDRLVAVVPVEIEAVRGQLERAARSKPLPAGMSLAVLETARAGIDDARGLWERAVTEQAANRHEEAVTLGTQALERSRSVAAVLRTAPAGSASGKIPPLQ
jgi:hypothetical protein